MKLGKGMYLNIIKPIYDKPIVSIITNGENLKSFTLKVRNEARVFILSTLIQQSFGIPNQSNKTGRNKRNSNRKGRSQIISNCIRHALIPIKDPKDPTKKLLDIIHTFSTKSVYKNQ
jgi:hypothetical protein